MDSLDKTNLDLQKNFVKTLLRLYFVLDNDQESSIGDSQIQIELIGVI